MKLHISYLKNRQVSSCFSPGSCIHYTSAYQNLNRNTIRIASHNTSRCLGGPSLAHLSPATATTIRSFVVFEERQIAIARTMDPSVYKFKLLNTFVISRSCYWRPFLFSVDYTDTHGYALKHDRNKDHIYAVSDLDT